MKNVRTSLLRAAFVFAVLLTSPCTCMAGDEDLLLISLAPPGGNTGRKHALESEHHPVPVRTYWLDGGNISADAHACVLHPDGSMEEIPLKRDERGVSLSFETPFRVDRMHGVHDVYAVDTRLEDRVLYVRVAKWITIHHSCGWGHEYRYVRDRIEPKSLESIPLEILCDGLWDGNFHSNVMAGDSLDFQVLGHGRPVEGAGVTLRTARGWTKEIETDEEGIASFRLIRDYYPGRWIDFDRRHRDRFVVTAVYEIDEGGAFSGEEYDRVRLVSSLQWHYSPSRKDYVSSLAGLSIGILVVIVSGTGVFVYRERRKKPFREVFFR